MLIFRMIVIFNKSMNFIRSNRDCLFNFSNQLFQIYWVISGIKVVKKCKISAQYLLNYTCKYVLKMRFSKNKKY